MYIFTQQGLPSCSLDRHLDADIFSSLLTPNLICFTCAALLTVLAQRGFFENAYENDISGKNSYEADNFMQTTEHVIDGPQLNILFAEAVKAPLLSSDSKVQVKTLNLIFLYLSWEGGSCTKIRVFVEENIADYSFEILRLSGKHCH